MTSGNVKNGLTAMGPPLGDPAEFLGLSGPETQLAIGARIDEYQQQIVQINERILALKSIHNAVTPIHTKVPSEILIHVFRHIEPDAYQHIQLSHVCRLWRSAIHRAAEFWVDILRTIPVIDRAHGRQLFNDFFERTAPLPFGVSLRSGDLTMIRHLPNNHLLRLTFLSIAFNRDYRADLLDLIDLKLPSLRHLICNYEMSRAVVDPPIAEIRNARPSDKIPKLLILNIHGRCITPAFFVTSLRDLRIFGAAMVSPDFILNSLRTCPSLEKLTVEDLYEEPPGAQTLADLRPPIPMGRLRFLTLSTLSGDAFASPFISHLDYPPTTQIKIIGQGTFLSSYLCHSSPPTSTPATSTIQRLVFTITPNHDDILSSCEVEGSSDLAPSRLSVLLWYGPWDFPAEHDHVSRFLDFPVIFSSSQAPALTHVTIRLERGLSVSYEDWHVVLGACPQIRHFAVRIASCRGLLRALRKYRLLPQLLTLSITCENGSGVHESLVSAIESRAAMDVSRLDELRFYTESLLRRMNVDTFPPFSTARLERLKIHVRDVYAGAKYGMLQLNTNDGVR